MRVLVNTLGSHVKKRALTTLWEIMYRPGPWFRSGRAHTACFQVGGQPRAWSVRVSLACAADELTHGVLGFSLPATQAKYSGMAALAIMVPCLIC